MNQIVNHDDNPRNKIEEKQVISRRISTPDAVFIDNQNADNTDACEMGGGGGALKIWKRVILTYRKTLLGTFGKQMQFERGTWRDGVGELDE
ncbi:hypothetical protein ABEW05_008792 [Botrytis cinerea]